MHYCMCAVNEVRRIGIIYSIKMFLYLRLASGYEKVKVTNVVLFFFAKVPCSFHIFQVCFCNVKYYVFLKQKHKQE